MAFLSFVGIMVVVSKGAEVEQRALGRALAEAEQQEVLMCLHEDRFQGSSPAQAYAALLDEGQFHCSIRTMYRLSEARGESRERRDQSDSSAVSEAGAASHSSQSVVELGHHQTARPSELDLLSPLCHLGCLQPSRRALDDRLSRERRTGQAFDRSFLPQTTHHARPVELLFLCCRDDAHQQGCGPAREKSAEQCAT
jgi:hypothetical protein